VARKASIAGATASIVLLTALSLGSAATVTIAAAPTGEAREEAALQLEQRAQAAGALGIYFDAATDQYVVALPPSAKGFLSPGDVADLGLPVAVQTRPIERKTVSALLDELEGMKSMVGGDYGFGFDPKSGRVIVQAEADEKAFAQVERQFPDTVDFHRGEWHLTADWSNDQEAHWGGAWLQGGGWACTSGFPIEDYSGHSYMVTAGHCFTNGTSTNMGTVLRESAAYPYYDFEVVYGHRYQGKVYDTPYTGKAIANGKNPAVGTKYCTTGRNSGFQCSWTMQRLHQTICYSNMSTCFHNLAGFNSPTFDHVLGGDSGGPIYYAKADYTVGVRGVISGYFWDIYTLAYMSYAQPYGDIANYYVMHAMTYP
jgi:hypothetical protein